MKEVIELLHQFFKSDDSWYKMIYFSGLGVKNKGDWCFTDGSLSIENIVDIIK